MKSKFLSVFSVFKFLVAVFGSGALSVACAHHEAADEPIVEATVPFTKTPEPQREQIRTVYVETPSTSSGTTNSLTSLSFDRAEVEPISFGSKVLQVFWPLLTMMATGLVFIMILLLEHVVLNKQLAKRLELRTQLQRT